MAVRWARLRRRLVIGVAVGLAALVVLAALAHLPVVRAGLLSIASARLRDRAGIELAARRLDYNLLTRWVTLEDVRLSARGSPHPFFEAPRARARLSWSVLIGTLAFDAVEIASPHVTFVRDPAGGWNLPHSTRQGPSSISWRIGRLLVSDLTFALNDAAGQRLDIDAEGVAITAGSTLVPRELRGHLTVSTRAHVGLDERTIDMTSLDGDFVYGDTGVALERVHATGPAGTLTVDGHVGPFDDPQLDLQIAGAIDVGRLERWVPLAGL